MKRLTTDEFIEKSREIHSNKYDYSNTNYINTYSKILIKCSTHGEFLQTPHDHLNGYGCRLCRSNNLSELYRDTKSQFVNKSRKIHGNKFNYDDVIYKNNNTSVIITCKIHGIFNQLPSNHLKGNGCPKCKSSKGELQISKFLKDNNIIYKTQKTFDGCVNPKTNYKLRFDFYVPSKNILIEYDGEQHFNYGGFVNGKHKIIEEDVEYIQYKDRIKSQYAKKNGIELLRIKYTDFNKINVILSSVLNA